MTALRCFARIGLTLCVLVWMGCPSADDTSAVGASDPVRASAPEGVADPEIVEPPSRPKEASRTNDISRRSMTIAPARRLTLDDLNPVIGVPAEPNRMPNRVEIRFDRPVVETPDAGVNKLTDVQIRPAVAGRWRFTDRYTLTYQPKVGFRPDTEYTVTLRALQAEGQGDARVGKRNYQHTFTTPSLRLLRLDLVRWSPSARKAEVEVVFSGPIKQPRPRSLRWTVDGIQRQVKLRCVRPDLWSASIVDPSLRAGSVVEVATVGDSVSSAVDVNISAEGRANVALPEQEALFIRGVAVVEGADGYFLKVLCHDESSQGPAIRFWDRDLKRRFQLSPRCLLDGQMAKQKVRVEPAVDFTVSPTRGGFRIHGPFARGPVTLEIEAGARSVDGGVTVSRYRRTVMIPARRPKLEFVAQGRYLPASAWGGLALRHQNVSAVDLSIRHVTRENVVRWLSDGGETASRQNSDVIFHRRIELQSETDVLATSTLAMQDFLPDPPSGLVEISVTAPGIGTRSTVRFSITDINILAKRSQSGAVQVWVLGAHDHRPVAEATVEMVVPSGRRVSQCRTDESGACALDGVEKEAVDQTAPFALLASTIDDFSFLRFDQLRLNSSDYDIHGATSGPSRVYRAAVYGDRGVYRPGDTAHVVAIVRDRQDVGRAELPVQIELLDPKRKVSRRLNRTTNEAGMVSADFAFADYADTGRYQTVFRVGQREIARYTFNVEEFVPERMEVSAETGATDYAASNEAQVAVQARYLFGGSAAGSRFDVVCSLSPATFNAPQHPDYVFDAWREQPLKAIQLGQVSGTLDEDGQGRLACPSLMGRGRLLGPTRLVAQASVFEAGSGRTTDGQASALVHPHSFYVGLKSDVQAVKVDRTFTVQGVVVDWNGAYQKDVDRASIELLKVEREHGWVYNELEGRWTYRRHTHLVSTFKREVSVKNGRFEISLKTPESARGYVVRARVQEAVGDLKLGGAWYSWWSPYYGGRADATPRPVKPDSLVVQAPSEVDVSETARVSVEVPHRGRLLWTVESSRLIQSKWVDVAPGPVEWSFKVDAFEPNVYVSALLLKDPHEEGKTSFLPSRSYGVTSVRVRPKAYIQSASIRAPNEVRSNQPLEIEVDLPGAERPSFITVAAVDEGILSLTKFKTPDPVRALFRRRALEVKTFETVGWNVSLPAGGIGRSTGGGGSNALGRIQMVKPVSLWSGVVPVPAEGPVKVRFDVPQYRGKLRVMVVGAGPKRLISASKSVRVRDPIVLQTTIPRFLIQGDEVQVPVFLTNTSGRPQAVEVRFSAEPLPTGGGATGGGATGGGGSTSTATSPLEVRGPAVRRVDLPMDGQATVIYRIATKAAVGAARLRIQAQTQGGQKSDQVSVQETLDVPFVPKAPRTRLVQRIQLPAGTLDLKPYLQGWLPTTESSTFWVTSNPYGDVFEHLTYLIRYPYGCIEQTTSSVRPLLFLADLVRHTNAVSRADIEDRAQVGIDRVLSMQTPSGGFGYWPGASTPVYWGTAYATHMLLEAKKVGFAVPQDRIDEALAWMSRALRTSSNPEQAQEAKPYIHYVLALAGRGEKAAMVDLLDQLGNRRSNDRWRWRAGQVAEMTLLLQAGLYLAGDRRFEDALLAVDTSPVQNDRLNGWAFYSDRRRRGLALSTLVEVFGFRPELEPLAQVVADGLRGRQSGWYTTQELAWGVTGLGKMLGKVTKSFAAPQLLSDGQPIEPAWLPAAKDDKGDRTFKLFRASERKSLELKTSFGPEDIVYLVLSSEGVQAKGDWKTGGEGIRIERRYRNQRGEIVDLAEPLELGDLLYVELTLRNLTGSTIQNVAVVDRLAAGWEIEDARMGRDRRMAGLSGRLWSPQHMNLRDDRIEAFGSLPTKPVKLVYLVRAVSAGTFSTPPVSAEAMYDPSQWARARGTSVTVRGPWDDE